MADSDDEPITLSSHALAALQDFYGERDAHADKFEKLKAAAEEQHSGQPLSMDAFVEDWNKSQFWYSEETATLLAKQLLDGVKEDEVIAVVSAPSAFVAMMNLLKSAGASTTPRPKKIYLLEHDNRFGAFPEYIFWDFNDKFAKLPADLKGGVDRIICDPPFLSDECQTKAAMTVRWMLRPTSKQTTERRPRLILCTGERMETLIGKLYGPLGVRTTTYEPRHARGLSNEFYCYANFECDEWQFRG